MNEIIRRIVKNPNIYKEELRKRGNDNFNYEKIIDNITYDYNEVVNLNKKIEEIMLKHKKYALDYSKNIDLLKKISSEKKDFQKKILKYNERMWNNASFLPNIVTRVTSDENLILHSHKSYNESVPNNNYNFLNIAEKFKLAVLQKASEVYGSRFVIYKNKGALLYRALENYFRDRNIEAGYEEIIAPVLLKKELLFSTGQIPKFENDLFITVDGEYLSPTSEVQLVNYYKNTFINLNDFPIKLSCLSLCFRKEVGSASTQNQSMLRLHQFSKAEIVSITTPESSSEMFDSMYKHICSILSELGLNFRVLLLGHKDVGFSASYTYDFEVYFHNSEKYVEVSSLSNCLDFQSIRGNIRYKTNEGVVVFPHTLNGSSLAVDRIFSSIIENFYNPKTNRIIIPSCLHKYLRFKFIEF